MFGQHIGQWGPCRQGVRIDLHHLAVRGVDKGRVPRREVAEALAAAVEHLHSRDLVTRKTHHQVMRQLGVAVFLFFGHLHMDDLAGLGQPHGAGELRLQILLDGVVPDERWCVIAGDVKGIKKALVAPDVAGVQDRFGNIKQSRRVIGVGAHPDRTTDFAAVFGQKGSDQLVVVQLVCDGGENLRTSGRSQAQDAQCLAFGGVTLLFAKVPDVLDQCGGECLRVLRPVKSSGQCLTLLQTAEALEVGHMRLLDQFEQAVRVGQGLLAH